MKNIHMLTIYLGSSGRCRRVFKDTARRMGQLIGEQDKTLVYGGMDAGLMGIVANAALSATAQVTGIIPKSLKDSERIHPNLSETILVPDLWERKRKMFKRADAIITLPGGFGTIDEALEALYWGYLGMHNKPVVLVNVEGYWDDFLAYLDTLPDLAKEYLIVTDSPEGVFEELRCWSPPMITGDPDHLPHFEGDILAHMEEPLVIDHASVKDSYILATALGLKQLGKHSRPMGLLNTGGQFDALLRWIDRAQEEHFITDRCKMLYGVDETMANLNQKMATLETIEIDLEHEKWGPGETRTHIEIKETGSK